MQIYYLTGISCILSYGIIGSKQVKSLRSVHKFQKLHVQIHRTHYLAEFHHWHVVALNLEPENTLWLIIHQEGKIQETMKETNARKKKNWH